MKNSKFWKKYLICALFTPLLLASCDSINDNISSDTNTEISSVVNAQDASMAVVFNQSISASDLDNITVNFPDSVDTTNLDLTKSLSYDEKTVVLEFNEIYTDSGETIEIIVTFGGQSKTVSYTTAASKDSEDSDSSGDSSNTISYLIISEYVEGSSSNKAIELYNTSSGAINLSDYTVKMFSNDSTTPSNPQALSGTIESGNVFVIANAGSSFKSESYVGLTSTVTYFNGNDAVGLYKGEELVDIIGTIGSSDDFAKDKTLTRKVSVKSGNTTYDPSEWNEQTKDYFDNLGKYTDGSGSSTSGSDDSSDGDSNDSDNSSIDMGDGNYTIPTDYYKNAEGKTGSSLHSALNDIISGHTELSYDAAYAALEKTDSDPSNTENVILLYLGTTMKASIQYDGGNGWNREHVWAKSHGDFGTSIGAGTDIHHLRATDISVNSARGNKEFDEGGTAHSEAVLCKTDSDSWEPRDEVKGDIARMLFYMAVRYDGENGEPDLMLSEDINDDSEAPTHGKKSILLKWHNEDPVDDLERRRNYIIYKNYQGNRNPFIDHPEYADLIWK